MELEQQNGPGASWIIASRTMVLSAALLAASACTFFYSVESARNVEFLYGYITFFFLLTAGSAAWLKYTRVTNWFFYTQTIIDVVLVTGAIYSTGGPTSPFLFLYLPVVMASAIFVSRAIALVTAFVVSAAYSTLIFLMLADSLKAIDGSSLENIGPGEVILQVVGLSSASILIAVATHFLTKSMKANAALAALREEHLKILHEKQQLIFDRLPEGVISTDLEDKITGINDSAKALLQLSTSFVGKSIQEFQEQLKRESMLEGELNATGKRSEITLSRGDSTIKLELHSKSLIGKDQQQVGRLYIFQDITRLRSVEEQLAMHERMARLLADQEQHDDYGPTKLSGFVGESNIMKKVFQLIERVAPSDATVLISGESGTGKELVAKAIHFSSQRASKPFIPVNCGAIPEQLLESELFGHKKGSFTGAVSDTLGLFRQADGGTLFLDEIGELPLQMQAKLLRAIQEKSVRPVGGDTSLPANVRIIAATNRNLKGETEAGRFREDLFYRLNVVSVHIPPLRDRKEDIPVLIKQILQKLSRDTQTPSITPRAMDLLMKYSYPGNVRELENILERAVVLGGEAVLPEHLPELSAASPAKRNLPETEILYADDVSFPVDLDHVLQKIEQHYLRRALEESRGIKKTAAELLGMNFRSFRYRLQKFEIEEESSDL